MWSAEVVQKCNMDHTLALPTEKGGPTLKLRKVPTFVQKRTDTHTNIYTHAYIHTHTHFFKIYALALLAVCSEGCTLSIAKKYSLTNFIFKFNYNGEERVGS
jgi:hypothetical protein